MSKVQHSHIVAAPLSQVWDVLKDFGGVHRFHPKVERSPLTSTQGEGVGAARICHFYDGTSVREEVRDYVEGERMTVQLSEFSMPLQRAEVELSVRAIDEETTEVIFEMDYAMKFGPLGAVMNSVMLKPMLTRMFGQVLEGLEHHVITGELVGRDGAPMPLAAAA